MTRLFIASLFLIVQAPLAWGVPIEAQFVVGGLSAPTYVTAAPGDNDRLFITEKGSGNIRIYNKQTGSLNVSPFMTVPNLDASGEGGLIGLAFHPDYQNNGLFYVNTTENVGGFRTRIRQYQRTTADTASAATESSIITYSQPDTNHNGGWIGFNPIANAANDNKQYLYIASGDGGGSNDPGNNGQNLNSRLGKILRVDVDGTDAFPGDPNNNYAIPGSNPFVGQGGVQEEIWAYGLRNPWRTSFDRATGDLYIGDVGQGAREEIDVQPASSTGGEDYGWRLREGTIATPGVGGAAPGAIDPIYDYQRGTSQFLGRSVTGGYVYRGPAEALQGQYIFGDFVSDQIWSLKYDGSDPSTFDGTNYTDLTDLTPLINSDIGGIENLASFGEDNQGNLYFLDLIGGELYLLTGDAAEVTNPAVPEPSSLVLAVLGVVGLIARRRYR